jgi:hypothetical protein
MLRVVFLQRLSAFLCAALWLRVPPLFSLAESRRRMESLATFVLLDLFRMRREPCAPGLSLARASRFVFAHPYAGPGILSTAVVFVC